MKNSFFYLFLATFIPLTATAQELDIDVTEFCKDEETIKCEVEPVPAAAKDLQLIMPFLNGADHSAAAKEKSCKSIMELAKIKAEPIEMNVDDDQGNKWKIRFHFGFTRTNIRPTDMKIKSSTLTTEIKGFQFDERTSGEHYNPATWGKSWQEPFRWIDEPSNTMTISIENKNNAFYITAFHPKFLRTYYQVKNGDQTNYIPANGQSTYLSEGTETAINAIPDGAAGIEIQNTHKLMNYSLGYGRKFKILGNKKFGELTYIARVDAGVITGAARSIYIVKGSEWKDERDKMRVQGYTASLGNRLEYTKGKVGVFVEHKYSKLSEQEYKFLDGTAKASGGDFSTVTFGVSVDLFDPNREKKLKKNKKKEEEKLSDLTQG